VIDDHLDAALEQLSGDMAADVAGTAGDQNLHGCVPVMRWLLRFRRRYPVGSCRGGPLCRGWWSGAVRWYTTPGRWSPVAELASAIFPLAGLKRHMASHVLWELVHEMCFAAEPCARRARLPLETLSGNPILGFESGIVG